MVRWPLVLPGAPRHFARRDLALVETVAVSGYDTEYRYVKNNGLCTQKPEQRPGRGRG
jgi:hypothetical protein